MGISFLCIGAGVIVAIIAGVLIYMTLAKAPARRYARGADTFAFTGVNAQDAGVRELLDAGPGALPYHWIVSATPQTIELRTNNRHAHPIVTIPRDQITAVSLDAVAGGAFVHRCLKLEINHAPLPIKLAFLTDSQFGIGTAGKKALKLKARRLGLDLANGSS